MLGQDSMMRLATLKRDGSEEAYVLTSAGLIALRSLNAKDRTDWPVEMLPLLESGRLDDLRCTFDQDGPRWACDLAAEAVDPATAPYAPLYRRPRKLWGIGLNYRAHAADLDEKAPSSEPASFLKPDTALIGPGDTIKLPKLSQKTTGEAELAIIFGRTCRDVPKDDWLSVVAGFTCVLDMTAEDILRRNPRNLTQCKSFDTFISFGPMLVTPDEIPDVMQLKVRTVRNGVVMAENVVAAMTFPPDFLVSYHSQIMTLLPGDVLSTGTPGATELSHGDVLEAHLDGFPRLVNPVIDLKS